MEEAAQEAVSMRREDVAVEKLKEDGCDCGCGCRSREREDLDIIECTPMVGEPLTMTDVV